MDRASTGHRKVMELNIGQILTLVLRNWWVVVLSGLLFAGGTWGVSQYLLPREYTAVSLFYVNNGAFADDNRFSGSDLDASRSLAETYTVILTANQTLNAALREADLTLSAEEAADMINAVTVENTELFQVTIQGRDPEQVGLLAGAIDTVFPGRIREIMPGSVIQLVQPSSMPTEPSSSSPVRNGISGLIFGVAFACSILVLRGLCDVTIRREEDLACVSQVPLLARIPEAKASRTGFTSPDRADPKVREAYRSLRTSLDFAADYPEGCRVIGVCSAMAGEGKSTTAAQLAYALSQRGSRVLLMDCDLRRPSIHQKLSLSLGPGLSDYLAKQLPLEELIRQYTLGETQFQVITAGRIPPNPGELLSSPRMGKLLDNLRQSYDVILVDLPPVGEVGDGIVMSRHTDGTLLVVRRGYCSSLMLEDAVEQFASVKKRILGIAFNCTHP